MKHFLLPLIAITLLAACGKDNKSGKKDSWSYTDPYLGGIDQGSIPRYDGRSVSTIISEVSCFAGGNGPRQQMQLPLTGFQTVIPNGDFYVGVTSYGDVGVVMGQGNNAPIFIAYLCPRSFMNNSYQGSVISNVRLGSYSQCHFKPLPSASLVFPNGAGSADFRMLDFGKFTGQLPMQPISFCRQ